MPRSHHAKGRAINTADPLPDHVRQAFDTIQGYSRNLHFQAAVVRDSMLTRDEELARLEVQIAHEADGGDQ